MRPVRIFASVVALVIALTGCSASFAPPVAKPGDILTVLQATSKSTSWSEYNRKDAKQAAYRKMAVGSIDMFVGGDCDIMVYRSAQSAFNSLHLGQGAIGDAWFYPGEFKSLGVALGVVGKNDSCANDATSALKMFSKVYGDNTTEATWTPTMINIDLCISHHLGCIAHYSLTVPDSYASLAVDKSKYLLQRLVNAKLCTINPDGVAGGKVSDGAMVCYYGHDAQTGQPYMLRAFANPASVLWDTINTNPEDGKYLLANVGWTLHADHEDKAILIAAEKIVGGRVIARPSIKNYKG